MSGVNPLASACKVVMTLLFVVESQEGPGFDIPGIWVSTPDSFAPLSVRPLASVT